MSTDNMDQTPDRDAVRRLMAEYPLAWVMPQSADAALTASLLPLVPVYDDEGAPVELIGHLARSNPLAAALHDDPHALILFSGPQGYVSPEYVGRRDWAPTWAYAQLRIQAEVVFVPQDTGMTLDVLIDAMERDRAQPWSTAEMGARYDRLLPAIIGFRARVLGWSGRFKLGQDEKPADRAAIIAQHPDRTLAHWIERLNR